jgi:glycosyltransferase involved in cell wall biosynthesis
MVIQAFAPVLGGAQRQIEQLAPLLAQRGVTVLVVTRRPPGTTAWEARPGLEVLRLGGPPAPTAASVAYSVRGTIASVRLGADVVHAHDLMSPSTIALAARRATGVPVVAKPLASGPHGDVRRLLTKPLGAARLRAMATRFAAFVCVSADIERDLVEHGVPPGRLRRIPNGVDADRFAPGQDGTLRARCGIGPGDPVALYCGRFSPTKRLDLLVGALTGARGHLVLAGEGPEEAAIRRAAAAAGVADRVHLLPTVSDPAPLYRAADVYVTASDQDGLSNAALEAMACGLPVVTTGAGGMAELVGDDAGAVVWPEELGAALSRLLADGDRRRALGRVARERVVRDYSLASTADRLTALYREVADGRAAANGR